MSIDRTPSFFRCARSAPGLESAKRHPVGLTRQAEMLLLAVPRPAVSKQRVGDMAAAQEPVASGRIYVRSVPSGD